MNHTPTPWKVCNDGECSCLTISCPDHPIAKVETGEWGDKYPAMRQIGASLDNKYEAYMERITYGEIAHETAKANALLIVRAVNSHDALVEALTEARLQIEYLHDKFQATGSGANVLAKIDAALAPLSSALSADASEN